MKAKQTITKAIKVSSFTVLTLVVCTMASVFIAARIDLDAVAPDFMKMIRHSGNPVGKYYRVGVFNHAEYCIGHTAFELKYDTNDELFEHSEDAKIAATHIISYAEYLENQEEYLSELDNADIADWAFCSTNPEDLSVTAANAVVEGLDNTSSWYKYLAARGSEVHRETELKRKFKADDYTEYEKYEEDGYLHVGYRLGSSTEIFYNPEKYKTIPDSEQGHTYYTIGGDHEFEKHIAMDLVPDTVDRGIEVAVAVTKNGDYSIYHNKYGFVMVGRDNSEVYRRYYIGNVLRETEPDENGYGIYLLGKADNIQKSVRSIASTVKDRGYYVYFEGYHLVEQCHCTSSSFERVKD